MAEKNAGGKDSKEPTKSADAPAGPAPLSDSEADRSAPPLGSRFARLTAPRELDDDDKRKLWGLPAKGDREALGDYIVELNVEHKGCYVPDDYIPRRSYPLFRAREVLEYLAAGGDAGSP